MVLEKEVLNEKDILNELLIQGKINTCDVQNIINMNKKEKVLEKHPFDIAQGKGKDKRWFTYVLDQESKYGRKKVGKQTEKELYDFLYTFYFEDEISKYKRCSLQDIYMEWLRYKNTLSNRSNYIRRIDCDYQRFYVNEELSKNILTKPLSSLTKIDIETWAYGLIKKHKLTKKAYYNMSIILRQVLEYLVDKEILEKSPYERVKIKSTSFRRVSKKKAETQIFYEDELKSIIEYAYKLAIEKKDENYLSIPLFFYSGIRLGECLGVEFGDFDEANVSVYIHQSLVAVEELQPDGTWAKRRYEIDTLKHNAEPREVLILQECFEIVKLVKQIKEEKNNMSDLLFTVETPAEIEYKLYSICNKLGILERSTHKIRKTYISNLLNNRIDPDFVREQVGHQDLQTTFNSYTYSTTRKEKVLKQLNVALAS